MPNDNTLFPSKVGETGGDQFGNPEALNSPIPQPERSPASKLEELGASLASMTSQEGNQQSSIQQLGSQLSTQTPSGVPVQGNVKTYSEDELKDFKDRFVLGMTRSLNERVDYLDRKFGKENVKVDDAGRVYFRRNDKQPFIPVDKESTGLFGGLTIQDIADILPDVAETAVQGMIGSSSTAAGAALGGMVGGPPGALVGGGIGMMAGIAGAPALTTKYKESLLKDLGVKLDPGVTFLSQWMPQAMWGAGGVGAGALLGKAVEGVGGLLSKIGESGSSLARIAAIKQNIKDTLAGLGYSGSSSADVAKSIMGKEGRLTKIVDQAGEKLGVMKEEAQKALNHAPVSLDETLTEMKNILSRNGIKFKPDGSAMIPGESFDLSPTQKIVQEANRDYFGMPNGSRVAEDMSNRFNNMLRSQRNGGVPFDELQDSLESFGAMATFEGIPSNARLNEAITGIRKGMTKDRNNYMVIAAANPQPGTSITSEEMQRLREHVQNVFDDYSKKKSTLDTFQNRYNQMLSDEKFNKALISSYDPSDLQGLKDILGENSQEWKNLVSDYFNSAMEKSTNPRTGVLEPDKMLKEFVGLTKEKRELLGFDDKFIGNLRLQANKFRESYVPSIEKKADKPLAIVDVVNAVLAGPLKAAELKYDAVARLLRNDVRLADYMLDDGFLKLSQSAVGREEALEFANKVREGMANNLYSIPKNVAKISVGLGAGRIAESAKEADKPVKEASEIMSKQPSKMILEFKNPMEIQSSQK